ncbi:IclR family transcriptional regulator C-terminal domain-containing protein, partial [Escherichia coli]|nr:IclR family transcriptional regulator C-terminal domain-containing protein [Escherichia coli]
DVKNTNKQDKKLGLDYYREDVKRRRNKRYARGTGVKKRALLIFFFQAEDGIRARLRSRGLGDVYKRQEDHIDALLPTEHLPAFTARTITTRKALKAELEVVRLQGWAFDNQEDVDDVTCIAAPVFNSDQAVVAAISISGVRFQMPEEKIPEYANAVMKAAG